MALYQTPPSQKLKRDNCTILVSNKACLKQLGFFLKIHLRFGLVFVVNAEILYGTTVEILE